MQQVKNSKREYKLNFHLKCIMASVVVSHMSPVWRSEQDYGPHGDRDDRQMSPLWCSEHGYDRHGQVDGREMSPLWRSEQVYGPDVSKDNNKLTMYTIFERLSREGMIKRGASPGKASRPAVCAEAFWVGARA